MDARFQLASVISRERKIEDARKAFKIAKQIGKKMPQIRYSGWIRSLSQGILRSS